MVDRAWAQGMFAGFTRTVVDLFSTAAIDVEWANDAYEVPIRAVCDSLPWFWDIDAWQSSGADNTAFPNGFSQVVSALAQGLDIRLNTAVELVTYGSADVAVRTSSGAIYMCDYCICTLPLGVLKSGAVTFNPELPSSKRGAISRLHVGLLNKVILEFPTGTELPPTDVVGKPYFEHGAATVWVNISNVTGKPTLVGWLTGPEAAQREDWPDEAIVSEAMERWPGLPTPVKSTITRWGQDPYAQGSYSSFNLDSVLGDRAELRKPVGRLLFAGEHTLATGFATVPGAWESGIREAERIINS